MMPLKIRFEGENLRVLHYDDESKSFSLDEFFSLHAKNEVEK